SSATASFSFRTGTTPRSSRRRSVSRACRYWLRCTKSSGARRTWPLTSPWRAATSSYTRMRRLWPTAEIACKVARSDGRAPDSPSAGSPAAIAPDVTMTTRWPWPRKAAASAQSLSTASVETAPCTSVKDDVPILATTITACRSSVRLELEGQAADANDIALARAGPRQGPVDAEPLQPLVHVGERLRVGQVGHRDGPLGLSAVDPEGAVVAPLDAHALLLGPVHDERLRRGQHGPCIRDETGHPIQQLVDTSAGHRRDGEVEVGVGLGGDVGLGADRQARPLHEVGLVPAELREQHALLLRRRRSADRGRAEVEQQAQGASALDVTQEPVAQAAPLAGALDEAGDVGDDELAVAPTDDTQVGLERGERVVGDPRTSGRDRRDQCALARVREADQRDVGHELELDLQPSLLTDLALFRERRRPPEVVQEAGVALATATAAGGHPAVAGRDQVGQHLAVLTAHDRALRHGDEEVVATGTVPALARAVGAVGRAAVRVLLEREQRRRVTIGDQPHVTTAATVAAVGPAARHVRLAAERHRAGTTVPPFPLDAGLVDEPGHATRLRGRVRHTVEMTGDATPADWLKRRLRPGAEPPDHPRAAGLDPG